MKNKIALKNVTLGDIHTDRHVNIELEFCEMLIEFAISIYIYFCMYFHLYFWMYFHEFKYSIPLVPVGIPSIDLYFLTIFVCAFSCN